MHETWLVNSVLKFLFSAVKITCGTFMFVTHFSNIHPLKYFPKVLKTFILQHKLTTNKMLILQNDATPLTITVAPI